MIPIRGGASSTSNRTLPTLIAMSAVALSVTNTLTNTALVSVPIPAMGANDALIIESVWTHTNSANVKTMRVQLSTTAGLTGTSVFVTGPTATARYSDLRTVWNRGATNSQVATAHTSGGYATASAGLPVTTAIETSAGSFLNFTAQCAALAESIVLESYRVEIVRAGEVSSGLNSSSTGNPTAVFDSAAGYTMFSRHQNTATRVSFQCLDASVGAAKWIALSTQQSGRFRTGKYYSTYGGTASTVAMAVAADLIYVYPYPLSERVTLASLNQRVVTAGTTSAVKMAVYADLNGVPTGAPLLADSTGQATVTANASVNCTMSGSLDPGMVWIAQKFTGTPATCVSLASDFTLEVLIGRAASNGNTALMALSTPDLYSNAWPTLSGGEVWTEVLGSSGVPLIRLVVA